MSGGMPVPQLERGEGEVTVGQRYIVRVGQCNDLVEDAAALLAQERLGQGQQRVEPGVAALVDGVPEAGEPSPLGENVVQRARHAVTLGHGQQLVGLLARTAVQRARQCCQSGQQCVVGVGADRRGDAHGHGRGGQLMVRHEDEGCVDGGRRHRRSHRCKAGGEPRRDGGTRVLPRRRRPHDVGQRGRGAAGGAGDRGGTEIGTEGIGGPAHDQRPAHALERGGHRARPEVGCAPVPRFLGLPQELGDLFEAGRRRQVGGGPATVDRAELLVELRHCGRDGGQPGRRLAPTPAARRQPLDLVQVEEAAPPGRVRMRLQQAPADVGVERRHLDPEAAGCLLGGQHALHHPRSYIDLINVYRRRERAS